MTTSMPSTRLPAIAPASAATSLNSETTTTTPQHHHHHQSNPRHNVTQTPSHAAVAVPFTPTATRSTSGTAHDPRQVSQPLNPTPLRRFNSSLSITGLSQKAPSTDSSRRKTLQLRLQNRPGDDSFTAFFAPPTLESLSVSPPNDAYVSIVLEGQTEKPCIFIAQADPSVPKDSVAISLSALRQRRPEVASAYSSRSIRTSVVRAPNLPEATRVVIQWMAQTPLSSFTKEQVEARLRSYLMTHTIRRPLGSSDYFKVPSSSSQSLLMRVVRVSPGPVALIGPSTEVVMDYSVSASSEPPTSGLSSSAHGTTGVMSSQLASSSRPNVRENLSHSSQNGQTPISSSRFVPANSSTKIFGGVSSGVGAIRIPSTSNAHIPATPSFKYTSAVHTLSSREYSAGITANVSTASHTPTHTPTGIITGGGTRGTPPNGGIYYGQHTPTGATTTTAATTTSHTPSYPTTTYVASNSNGGLSSLHEVMHSGTMQQSSQRGSGGSVARHSDLSEARSIMVRLCVERKLKRADLIGLELVRFFKSLREGIRKKYRFHITIENSTVECEVMSVVPSDRPCRLGSNTSIRSQIVRKRPTTFTARITAGRESVSEIGLSLANMDRLRLKNGDLVMLTGQGGRKALCHVQYDCDIDDWEISCSSVVCSNLSVRPREDIINMEIAHDIPFGKDIHVTSPNVSLRDDPRLQRIISTWFASPWRFVVEGNKFPIKIPTEGGGTYIDVIVQSINPPRFCITDAETLVHFGPMGR